EWGLATMREAGIHVSPAPSAWTVNLEVTRAKRLFEKKTARFGDMAPSHHPNSVRLVDLFASLFGPTFFSNRDVLSVLSSQLIRCFYRYGAPEGSPAVYAALAMVLTTKFGDLAVGYRIGKLAEQLAERSGNAVLLSKTKILLHA